MTAIDRTFSYFQAIESSLTHVSFSANCVDSQCAFRNSEHVPGSVKSFNSLKLVIHPLQNVKLVDTLSGGQSSECVSDLVSPKTSSTQPIDQ